MDTRTAWVLMGVSACGKSEIGTRLAPARLVEQILATRGAS